MVNDSLGSKRPIISTQVLLDVVGKDLERFDPTTVQPRKPFLSFDPFGMLKCCASDVARCAKYLEPIVRPWVRVLVLTVGGLTAKHGPERKIEASQLI